MPEMNLPSESLQVGAAGHQNERHHFLQALDRVHHLVSGFVLLDDLINQVVHLSPVFGANVKLWS
jgi:hypothetical protein